MHGNLQVDLNRCARNAGLSAPLGPGSRPEASQNPRASLQMGPYAQTNSVIVGCRDLLRCLVVVVPSVSAVGPQPRLYPGSRLAVTVRDEVIGVPPSYCVVGFEVAVGNHMMIVPLEECDL